MKTKTLILCFLLVYTTSFAQQTGNQYLLQGKMVSTNFVDTIKIDFQRYKIIVPVLIGGKIRRFILDTGAPLLISKQIQEEMKFDKIKTSVMKDVNEKVDSTDFVKVADIQIGKTKFKDIPAVVYDFEQGLLSCFNVDGLIGSNLLRHTIVSIDTKKKELILTDNENLWKSKRKYATELWLNEVQNTPIVQIYPFEKASEKLVLDLGSDDFYALSLRNFQFFQQEAKAGNYIIAQAKGASSVGLYGIENDTSQYLLNLTKVKINKTIFTDLEVITSIDNNSRIGAKLLDYGTIVIDYLHRQFYFIPFDNKNEINISMPNIGFLLKPENGTVGVGVVWDNSEAYKKGIKSNDIVKAIDDYDLTNKSLCELFFQIRAKIDKKGVIKFTLLDENGMEKIVELENK